MTQNVFILLVGKHVLCEKPLGMNVKETKEIIELARAKKVFLMEAMWARLQPAQLQLKEELDKGTIGKDADSRYYGISTLNRMYRVLQAISSSQ